MGALKTNDGRPTTETVCLGRPRVRAMVQSRGLKMPCAVQLGSLLLGVGTEYNTGYTHA